jgi:microcystin-dependent protein
MSQPYIGEIRLVGFNFAPANWAFCNGQLLSISNNTTLFNLIGTTYGGDGQNTFALPDLRGRSPVHTGGPLSYQIGQSGGVENVTLTAAQLPSHNHAFTASGGGGTSPTPASNFLAGSSLGQYAPSPGNAVSGNLLGTAGGSQPHSNLMPYVTMNFVISLYGVYPSRN